MQIIRLGIILRRAFFQVSSPVLRTICFWLCFQLWALGANAQHVYRGYSTIDGLPSSTVFQCQQDSLGFMWFATGNGLCRFDGSEFVDMKAEDNEDLNVQAVSLAVSGNRVIAGTANGFMAVSDRTHAHKIGVGPQEVDDARHRIVYVKDYLYYRTADNHLAVYDMRHRRQYHIGSQDMSRPFCMTSTPKGTVYYGQQGLYRVQGFKTTLLPIPQIRGRTISALSCDSDGRLWLVCNNTIYCLRDEVLVDSVQFSGVTVSPVSVCHSRIFGLVVYDQQGHGNKACMELSHLINGDTPCLMTSLFEDRDGNLWVNTYNKGTYCVLNSYISTFTGRNEAYDAPMHDVVANGAGVAWMATSFGVISKQGNTFRVVEGTSGQRYDNISATSRQLLFSAASGDSSLARHIGSNVPGGQVCRQLRAERLCLLGDSQLLYKAWKNEVVLADLDFRSGSLQVRKTIPLDSMSGSCRHISRINARQAIVVTHKACYLLDLTTATIRRMPQIDSEVSDVAADASGTLYLASRSGLYTVKQGQTHLLKELGGIALKNLSALAIDRGGRLWIGFNKGLIAWKGNYLKRISCSPYMRSQEINRLFYEAGTNQLFVATNSGLSVIDITKMDREVLRRPELVLHSVQSGERRYDPSGEIELEAGNDDVDIYFSVVAFNSPQDLYVRYTLNEGRSWAITSGNKISLRSLGHGARRLLIQASGNGVDWGRVREVRIWLAHPFYATWSFWLLVLISLGLLLSWMIRRRIRRIRLKAESEMALQQKMEELRYQALNAAVSPHFIFNTLGAIQGFVMNRDPFQASDYIAKFARLIRITLNYAGEKYIRIEEELTRLQLYLDLEKLRCGEKLEYHIEIEPTVDLFKLIPNMIIQPMLENAIQHGILPLPPHITGRLDVIIGQERNRLTIRVRDNGVGISRDTGSKHGYVSIGIDNLRERLALIKGSELSVTNLAEMTGGERGTLVVITIDL